MKKLSQSTDKFFMSNRLISLIRKFPELRKPVQNFARDLARPDKLVSVRSDLGYSPNKMPRIVTVKHTIICAGVKLTRVQSFKCQWSKE